jgi:hypothetical protein
MEARQMEPIVGVIDYEKYDEHYSFFVATTDAGQSKSDYDFRVEFSKHISEEQATATAERICSAYNNHDALIAALQDAMNIIDRLGEEYRDSTDRHSSYSNGEHKRLTATLEKAKLKN